MIVAIRFSPRTTTVIAKHHNERTFINDQRAKRRWNRKRVITNDQDSPNRNAEKMNQDRPVSSAIAHFTDQDALHTLNSGTATAVALEARFSDNVIFRKASKDTVSCSLYADDTATPVDDTIHYLSPASMTPLSTRTENEGDFLDHFYKTPSFIRFLEGSGKAAEASYVSSSISCVEPQMQRTLAIVKPEAMEFEDVIVRAIVEAGFSIIQKRYIHFTPEQLSEVYSQHYGSPEFPHLVVSMSEGPILSLCLGAVNAVEKWKDMVGTDRILRYKWFFPMSMRVRFGLHHDIPGAVHASENLAEASKENRYVNPDNILEPLITEERQVWDYSNMHINPTLINGLADVLRAKPIDPILHLAEWLLNHNPLQPQFPESIAILPT